MIFFMSFFIFNLMKFSILTPFDTLNLAVGCSLSYEEGIVDERMEWREWRERKGGN